MAPQMEKYSIAEHSSQCEVKGNEHLCENLIKTKYVLLHFTWIISLTVSNTGVSGMTTVLNPAKINITVGVSGDAGVSCVEVFIYIWIEDRVEINKAFITG